MARRPVQLFESKDAAELLRIGKLCDVRKDALVDREPAEKDATGSLQQVAFILSDASKDRYGDTVAADGWDFTSFNANRVLLWAHDYGEPPVGRLGEPWKTVGNKIKAVVEDWVPQDVSAFAYAIEQMVRRGFLNACSVGFRPTEYSYNDDYSINYIKQELLEVSVVPVPANPNALVAAKSAGLWVPEIDNWLEKKLDEKKPGVPFQIAKFAWSVVRSPSVTVPGSEPANDEPLPELVELRGAVEANTAAVKLLEQTMTKFIEHVQKAQVPAPPPPVRLDAARIAARALEIIPKSKFP